MDLSKKGWLEDYLLSKVRDGFDGSWLMTESKGIHPDQSLYAIIQPMGLMYGYPVKHVGNSGQKVSIKSLLLDALLASFMQVTTAREEFFPTLEIAHLEGVKKIATFYNSVYSELYTSSSTFFGKKKQDTEVVEKILAKRVENVSDQDNFWSGFFHNSLLFLDVYFFRQWVQTGETPMVTSFLTSQKEILRLDVVKVMAAAAHSDNSIDPEEQKLFEHFINALAFTSDKKQEAITYFEQGVGFDDIPLPTEDTWILKKYLFELAILTTWADRKIEKAEEEFLKEYNSRLGFSSLEYKKSFLAVEGFVLAHWEELVKLQAKSDFDSISDEYMTRLRELIHSHQDVLKKEITSRSTLMNKLVAAKTGGLSEEAKSEVQKGIVESIQNLPVFEIIALPTNFLTLPVLMDILPDNFFSELDH